VALDWVASQLFPTQEAPEETSDSKGGGSYHDAE